MPVTREWLCQGLPRTVDTREWLYQGLPRTVVIREWLWLSPLCCVSTRLTGNIVHVWWPPLTSLSMLPLSSGEQPWGKKQRKHVSARNIEGGTICFSLTWGMASPWFMTSPGTWPHLGHSLTWGIASPGAGAAYKYRQVLRNETILIPQKMFHIVSTCSKWLWHVHQVGIRVINTYSFDFMQQRMLPWKAKGEVLKTTEHSKAH